jgi:hypothetical protein
MTLLLRPHHRLRLQGVVAPVVALVAVAQVDIAHLLHHLHLHHHQQQVLHQMDARTVVFNVQHRLTVMVMEMEMEMVILNVHYVNRFIIWYPLQVHVQHDVVMVMLHRVSRYFRANMVLVYV